MYSNGVSFFTFTSTFNFRESVNLTGSYSDDKIVIADFNGDGRSDILHGFPVWVDDVSTSSIFSVYYTQKVGAPIGSGIRSVFYFEQYEYDNVLAFGEFVVGDFNGDGRSDLLNRFSVNSPADFISFNSFGKERLLVKITNGHNLTTSFDYKLLTDKTTTPYVYNRTLSLDNASNQYPYNYIQLPLYVVSSLTVPDGIGGNDTTKLFYENAVVHRTANGFLGFKKITAQNIATGLTSISLNEINTQFATLYTTKQQTFRTATSELLSEKQITSSFANLSTSPLDKRFFQKIVNTLTIDYLKGNAAQNINTYDAYGNITTNILKLSYYPVSTVIAETITTINSYGIHNTPVPSMPDNTTITKLRGTVPATKTTVFTYTSSGLLASQTDFSGLLKAVTKSYSYNEYGNPTGIVVSSTGLGNRTTNLNYDSKNRFVVTKEQTGTNVSQNESYTYDGKWGRILSQTSSDCLTTNFEYDAFGRLIKTNFPQGFSVPISLNWDVQANNVYNSFVDFPGGSPDKKTWYDKLDRETKTQTLGFNNQWLTHINEYDARGNIATETNHYYSSEAPLTTTNSYDVYNRLQTTSNALGTSDYTYVKQAQGKFQITKNRGGQYFTKVIDEAGKQVTIGDNGDAIKFEFNSWDNISKVGKGPNLAINLMTNAYDEYGRQAKLVDNNAGTFNYEYDAYGQLTRQIDNLGNTYLMAYDDLGRMISKQGPGGNYNLRIL